MGKPTGFMEWPRSLPVKQDKKLRVRNWNEFTAPASEESSKQQAGRCMDCGVPFCHQGCPLGNQIPDWNELVFRDHWQAAYRNLASTNNFPEFTGRLCPAPCEAACVLAINRDPVTIEEIEKDIAERAWTEGWVVPRKPTIRTGKRVAIVGSGPAGLAAASQLNAAGHAVTVFERSDRLGGLLRYGIPDFKIEKRIVDRRLAVMEAEGIEFRTGISVGMSPAWQELRETHDAVVIAIGAESARELNVPGRDLGGIHLAMDYLEQQNRIVSGQPVASPRIDAAGLRVMVLGGGDTGSDCVGTAHRQGAASVTQAEILPRPPDARTSGNSWPQWPMVFRTSSSQDEGGEREFSFATREFRGERGRVRSMIAVNADGAERAIQVDLVLLALGFTGPSTAQLVEQLGVVLDTRGNVAVDAKFRTSVPGVFCAGDARKGASLVVWAISDGRETARAVDAHLAGDASVPERLSLPSRGADAAFGGR